MNITVLQQRKIYKGKVFDVHQEQVRFPNGHESSLDIIRHGGAVVILPVDRHNQIYFIRQYRHAVGEILLELPAGTLEPGEDPFICANRELREETGMSASNLEKIGEFYIAPGYSTEYLHIFLATDLQHDPLTGDDDELITIELINVHEAYEIAAKGDIRDAKTLATLLLASSRLK